MKNPPTLLRALALALGTIAACPARAHGPLEAPVHAPPNIAAAIQPGTPAPAPAAAPAGASTAPTVPIAAPAPARPSASVAPAEAGPMPAPPTLGVPSGATAPSAPRTRYRVVDLPLRLNEQFLNRLVSSQLFDTQAAQRIDVDRFGCSTLLLRNPRLSIAADGLHVRAEVDARIGATLGATCTHLARWKGLVDMVEIPKITPDGQGVDFDATHFRLLEPDGKPAVVLNTLLGWMTHFVKPRMSQVLIDLRSPLAQLRGLLPTMFHFNDARRLQHLIESVHIERVATTPGALELWITLSAPVVAPAATPQAPLGPEEMSRVEAALSDLDAFLTFVVKESAGNTALVSTHRILLDVLINTRYHILRILSHPVPPGADPVRQLFLQSWQRLAPIAAQLGNSLPGAVGLRYLAFVTAGDALRAIDALGPGSGLDISADGLRRLARIIAPHFNGDPLRYEDGVDPVLRRRLGFGAPLPLPPATNPQPESFLSPLSWLIRGARAATRPHLALATMLRGPIATSGDLRRHLRLVGHLLSETARRQGAPGRLPRHLRRFFRNLVLSTAWQESCWRQFTRVNGKVVPLRSSVGALGIMQVNPRIWRGFYDPRGLADDIAYNASAGTEILRHYLVDVVLSSYGRSDPPADARLARAVYATYHGGPALFERYRAGRLSRRLVEIGRAFLEKYRRIARGDEDAVASCYAGQ